jgi:hypothetical protein
MERKEREREKKEKERHTLNNIEGKTNSMIR